MSKHTHPRQMLAGAAAAFLWTSITFPTAAHAYVDPGSGSVIVTAILGAIGAVGYTFRKYFYRLRRLFSGKRSGNE